MMDFEGRENENWKVREDEEKSEMSLFVSSIEFVLVNDDEYACNISPQVSKLLHDI